MRMHQGVRLALLGGASLVVLFGCRKNVTCDTTCASAEICAKPVVEETAADDGMSIWFRDGDLNAMMPQEIATYSDAAPGEAGSLGRDFDDAPPQIPHSVDGMLPIMGDENACLDCHLPGEDDEVINIPESHFMEVVMQKNDGAQRFSVSGYEKSNALPGTRWNCTLCHFTQATNTNDLKNDF